MELIKNLSLWSELRKYDCFVFALLSHGDGNEMGLSVEFSDRGFVDVEDILTQFNNLHCKHLVGKPKIFLFPFCRYVSTFNATKNAIYSIEKMIKFILFGFAEADCQIVVQLIRKAIVLATLNWMQLEQIYPHFMI